MEFKTMKADRGKKEHRETFKPLAILDGDTIIFRDNYSRKVCIDLLRTKKYQLFQTDERGRITPM